MSIYIASRKLKIDMSLNVVFLNNQTIPEVTTEDIFISQGTIRDDLILKLLIDRGVLPFVISYSESSKLSILLKNLSLHIQKPIKEMTQKIINESINLQKHFTIFNTSFQNILEKEHKLNELNNLYIYQQFQLFNFSKEALKSMSHIKKTEKQNIYIDKKKILKGKIKIFIILQDNKELRVLKLEGESKEDENAFISNTINNNFEAIMKGEKISFKNRKFSFACQEITSQYKKDFLLFGIDDISLFKIYQLYDIQTKKEFKKMGLYETSKEIKLLNQQGLLALDSLQKLLKHKKTELSNLDTFLLSTSSFKTVIPSIKYEYQKKFKKTIISDMLSKIYDNIIEEKYQKSNLRYALSLLITQPLESITPKQQAHVFYDIQQGINLQKIVLQENFDFLKKKDDYSLVETIYQEVKEDKTENLIQHSDIQKFIKLFLNTLLSMDSSSNIKMDKTLHFISLFIYVAFEKELKTTNKNGEEKFQIDHCYMIFINHQIKYNKNEFLEYIDYFINEESYPKSIESYLLKYFFYECHNNTKEITFNIQEYQQIEKKENLRQQNSKFTKKLITIGLFYKNITQEEQLDNIIASLFKKIKENNIPTAEHCKESISFKFLALFFQGHGKKDCYSNLKAFFEEAKYFLKET